MEGHPKIGQNSILIWIKVTWKTGSERRTLALLFVPLRAGDESPPWKAPPLLQEVDLLLTRERKSGPRKLCKQTLLSFFTNWFQSLSCFFVCFCCWFFTNTNLFFVLFCFVWKDINSLLWTFLRSHIFGTSVCTKLNLIFFC